VTQDNISVKEYKEMLIGFLLPFISLPEQQAFKHFVKFFTEKYCRHVTEEIKSNMASMLLSESADDADRMLKDTLHARLSIFNEMDKPIYEASLLEEFDTVCCFMSLFRKMLTIVLSSEYFLATDDNEKEAEYQELESKIEKILEVVKPVVRWRGKDYAGIIGYNPPGNEDDRQCRQGIFALAQVTRLMLNAFHYENPVGANFIGLCPKCGKFFEKKRKDQDYCSKKCGDAVRAKRSYNSKKEK